MPGAKGYHIWYIPAGSSGRFIALFERSVSRMQSTAPDHLDPVLVENFSLDFSAHCNKLVFRVLTVEYICMPNLRQKLG